MPSAVDRAAPGQVADDEVLDPDDDLAGARRPRRLRARPIGSRSLREPFGRLAPVGLEPLEPRLVLVHLAELAMAPIALDELPLALDRLRLRVDVLGGAGVALDSRWR